ncbi:MAG: ATP-binding protein [Deltaproteobacteria bacterium]|nr:ATP-binding protein [Deltaproteobacteria bacterium]
MSFRARILLAQAPLAVALVVVAVLSVRTIGALGAGAEAILQQNYRSVLAAQRMRGALEALDRAALFALVGHPPPPDTDAQRQRFESELALEESNITEVGEGEAVQALRAQWSEYVAALAALRAAPDAARATYFAQTAPAFAALSASTSRILELNQDAMLLKSEHARATAARMGTVMIVASLAALALGLLATSLLTARLVQPLQRLRAVADRIGGGDFAARVTVEGRDELAQLATTFNAMADRLSRYRSSSLGELLLAQQAAQAAIDSLPDAVVVFDARGEVLIINQSAEHLLGGGRLSNADPMLRAVLEQARGHVLTGKGAFVPRGFEDAVRIATPGEGDLYFLARATPVYGEEGGVTGATVALQDVTRLHRFDQLKNDLVATVAHEVRTPLTALRMAVHLLLEHAAGPLTDRQADLLYAAREETERLQRIVEELLDLAKLQGGRMQLTRRPTAPRVLVDAALDAQRTIAADRQVVLTAQVAPGLPEIAVDVDRLQLVFANLLSNAVRHSPPGAPVTLRVAPHDGSLRFSVTDEGPGIPPERREVIFEKFSQGGDRPGGAGLGLSIAKEIVAAHGGEIGVDSSVGHGSEFWFTIPVGAKV